VFDRVTELLKTADNLDAVKHIFTHAMYEPQHKDNDPIWILANELKRANDLLLTSAT